MIHQGKQIKALAYNNGLKQKDLAKLRNVSEQAISWELKQEKLSPDTLKAYATILNVDYVDLIKGESSKTNNEDYLAKYLRAIEENNFLKTILLKNGIKVDFPNFNMGVPASDFGQQQHKLIFFYKGVQKRIHPTQY